MIPRRGSGHQTGSPHSSRLHPLVLVTCTEPYSHGLHLVLRVDSAGRPAWVSRLTGGARMETVSKKGLDAPQPAGNGTRGVPRTVDPGALRSDCDGGESPGPCAPRSSRAWSVSTPTDPAPTCSVRASCAASCPAPRLSMPGPRSKSPVRLRHRAPRLVAAPPPARRGVALVRFAGQAAPSPAMEGMCGNPRTSFRPADVRRRKAYPRASRTCHIT